MSTVSVTGLPAIAWFVGIVVVGSVPVWFAAKITGAGYATLPRAAISLLVGSIAAFLSLLVGGSWVVLLAPVSYWLSFKFILDTSLLGAFILCVLALAGYAAMAKLIGGGIAFT